MIPPNSSSLLGGLQGISQQPALSSTEGGEEHSVLVKGHQNVVIELQGPWLQHHVGTALLCGYNNPAQVQVMTLLGGTGFC